MFTDDTMLSVVRNLAGLGHHRSIISALFGVKNEGALWPANSQGFAPPHGKLGAELLGRFGETNETVGSGVPEERTRHD